MKKEKTRNPNPRKRKAYLGGNSQIKTIMTKLIIDGSQMQCTLGISPDKIEVTSQSFAKIKDKLIATDQDINSITNIPSFKSCKRSRNQPACIPQPLKWENVSELDSINGMKKLTINSTCQCQYGGKISFIDTADNSFVDSE